MFSESRYLGSWPDLARRLDTTAVVESWAATEPALAGLATADELVGRWREPACKHAVLAALVRLAAADGGRDDDALLVSLWLLTGLIQRLRNLLWRLGDEVGDVIVAELSLVIRGYRHDVWRGSVVQTLDRQTRRAVLAELRPSSRYYPERIPFAVPDADLLAAADHVAYATWRENALQLDDVLDWAARGGVDPTSLDFLVELEHERDRYRSRADYRVATRHGISYRTVFRRRASVLTQLRALAPAYLADVA
jgi:hypothetical protein